MIRELDEVKVGDKLVQYGNGQKTILTVTGITKTQVSCGKARFTLRGKKFGTSGFKTIHARKPKDEHELVTIDVENRRLILAQAIRATKWERLALSQLLQIKSIVDATAS